MNEASRRRTDAAMLDDLKSLIKRKLKEEKEEVEL